MNGIVTDRMYLSCMERRSTKVRNCLFSRRAYRGTVRAGDVVISKLADLASPVLLQTCSSGKTLARAKIEFLRADSNGDRIKYFEIEMENVLIGAVVPSIRAGNILTEHMSLKYSKVKWKYTQQKITGGIAGNTAGGWDLSTNRMC